MESRKTSQRTKANKSKENTGILTVARSQSPLLLADAGVYLLRRTQITASHLLALNSLPNVSTQLAAQHQHRKLTFFESSLYATSTKLTIDAAFLVLFK